MVAEEHRRERGDGALVFYREMHLPIHLLKGVWVKTEAVREEVERFFVALGVDVPVRTV